MGQDDFIRFKKHKVDEGQHVLANTMRALVYQADPDLFEALSEAPDDTFLEPLLFAYFSMDKAPVALPQVLLGSLDKSIWPEVMEVHTDGNGRLYLPKIGYFLTAVRERPLLLHRPSGTRSLSLTDEKGPVRFRFEEILKVPGTNIDVYRYVNPLLATVLTDSKVSKSPVEVAENVQPYLGYLERSLAIIRRQYPDFYQNLEKAVKQIVIFHSSQLNSCASVGAHGIAFLNVKEGDDEVFFVDDLVHQCGHVIFNAITVHRKDYIAVDPETPISEFSKQRHDARSVYTVLHGAYTEYEMVQCLRICEEGVFSGRQGNELTGRLACIFQKSEIDLENLAHEGIFTEQGQYLYHIFKEAYDRLRKERPELSDYDMSNQPYNFSYEQFLRANSIQSRDKSRSMAR